jgi:hypothetical protein
MNLIEDKVVSGWGLMIFRIILNEPTLTCVYFSLSGGFLSDINDRFILLIVVLVTSQDFRSRQPKMPPVSSSM